MRAVVIGASDGVGSGGQMIDGLDALKPPQTWLLFDPMGVRIGF